MDPALNDLLSKFGVEVGSKLIQSLIAAWEKRKNRKVDEAKKKEIAAAAESMILQATADDLRHVEPVYKTLDRLRRPPAKKAAPKKAATAKRRWAPKKAAPKRVAVTVKKRSTAKPLSTPVKKVSTKRSAAKRKR